MLMTLLAFTAVCCLPAFAFAQGPVSTPVAGAKEVQEESLFNIIFSGGPLGIGIMVVLIALSIIAVYLIFDQWLTLRRKDLIPATLNENVKQLLSQGKLKDADSLCRSQPSPMSYVLASGIAEIEYGWPAVEKSIEAALAEQAARMHRKLEYLSVIGNLASLFPPWGLLRFLGIVSTRSFLRWQHPLNRFLRPLDADFREVPVGRERVSFHLRVYSKMLQL